MVKIKSIYDSYSQDDGYRLLIMWKWPRGIARGTIDEWRKELGPSQPLLDDWQRRRISWEEFSRCYQQEMVNSPEAIGWLKEMARHGTVTLLCGCKDETRCHQLLLRQMVE